MSAGSARIELVLELRNRIRAGMSSARSQLNSGVSSMRTRLAELRSGTSQLFNSITSQIPGVGDAIGSLANPYALVAAGVAALGTAYIKASRMAAEWAKGMAKVNVTAQLSREELASLSKQVMEIGARNATPLEEVPDSFNKVVSAGLSAQEALAAFEPILKGAKAGFTDLDTVAAATVATMNSTGMKDATQVLDVLFATMNKGNAEFADIANYLPKIIPMAEKAGQSFQDTAGAFAYFTAQGFKSEQTATLLENTFKAISDPKITDGFKKIGVNIYDSHGKAKPLLEILDSLRGKLKGLSSEAKNELFKTIGADGETVTSIGAMLKDYEKLKDIIGFTNKSQGQLNEAIKNAETPMDVWAVISNQVKMGMIQIGQTSLPIIKAVGTYILESITYWKTLYNESMLFRDLLSLIGGVFSLMFKTAATGIGMIISLFKGVGNVLSNISIALGGTGDGFEGWYMRIKPYILWIAQYLGNIAEIGARIVKMDFSGAWKATKNVLDGQSIDSFRKQVGDEYQAQKNKNKDNPLMPATTTTPPVIGGGKGGGKGGGSTNATQTTGSAQQIKNITINMDAMVKMGDFVSKNPEISSMSKKELEQWFIEMSKRLLGNLETSYG